MASGDSVFKRLQDRLPEERRIFSDGHRISAQYITDVLQAADGGIMLGSNTKEFLPQKALTRAELATILARVTVIQPFSSWNRPIATFLKGLVFIQPSQKHLSQG